MKQQGIYYERDDPSESYSVIFLNIAQNTQDISEVRNQLYALWQIYEDLKIGKGRELPNPPNGPKDFTFLIGYSRKLFQSIKQNSILPSGFRVRDRLPNFNNPGGNGPVNIWENSGFAFSEGVSTNRADADIVIQFISDKESETKRAVLETWKYLEDKSLLNLSGYYSGFQRTDNRNMLDFLDGISNLPPGDREKSIFNDGTIFRNDSVPRGLTSFSPSDRNMLADSTYMCFLRILIDLPKWKKNVPPKIQEEILGRDKITGCPLDYEADHLKPVQNCPVPGTDDVLDIYKKNSKFIDYKFTQTAKYKMSHIGRVRKFDNDVVRIFRQGYNFFEESNEYPYFKTGLNFVSFQKDLSIIHLILTSDQWLGKVNFGGEINNNPVTGIFSVEAAGMFFVPPMNNKFPGYEIFQ